MDNPGATTSLFRADVLRLGLASLTVVLTWLLVCAWTPDALVSGQDGITQWLPLLTSFNRTDGIWDPAWMGGTPLLGTTGDPWLIALLRVVGASPVTQLNVVTLASQVVLATLVTAYVDASRQQPHPDAGFLPVALLSAFAPVLGVRIGVGHQNLLWALCGVVAVPCLLGLARAGKLTWVTWTVGVYALTTAMQTYGHQMLAYAATLVLPLVLALWWSQPGVHVRASLVWMTGAFAAAVCLALPVLVPMVQHALSGDAARALGDVLRTPEELAWRDVWWSAALQPALWFPDPPRFVHEHTHPWGPSMALAVWGAWRTSKTSPSPSAFGVILVGLGISAGLSFAYAVGHPDVTAALDGVFPVLRAFRVPSRVMLVLLPVALLVGLRALPVAPSVTVRTVGVATAVLLLPSVLPGTVVEVLAWMALAAIVWSARPEGQWAGVALLAGCSVAAFAANLSPMRPETALAQSAQEEAHNLHTLEPALEQPFNRAVVRAGAGTWGPNAAVMLDVPSVEGYAHAPRRFAELYGALTGQPVDAGTILFMVDLESNAGLLLQRLYNAGRVVSHTGESWKVNPTQAPKPAWLSALVEVVPDVTALAQRMRSGNGVALLDGPMLLNQADPGTAVLRDVPAWNCGAATVGKVRGVRVTVEQDLPGKCLLVMAVNHLERVEAWGSFRNGETRVLPSGPVMGALRGVVLEPGVEAVELKPRVADRWPWVGFGAGVLLLLFPLVMLFRRQT